MSSSVVVDPHRFSHKGDKLPGCSDIFCDNKINGNYSEVGQCAVGTWVCIRIFGDI